MWILPVLADKEIFNVLSSQTLVMGSASAANKLSTLTN
jgi:hypothetical protein